MERDLSENRSYREQMSDGVLFGCVHVGLITMCTDMRCVVFLNAEFRKDSSILCILLLLENVVWF